MLRRHGETGIEDDQDITARGVEVGEHGIALAGDHRDYFAACVGRTLCKPWELLKQWLPGKNILLGDAANLDPNLKFDIVFQSTVFTSILENDFRQRLAKRMWELTKPGGIVLWYDFEFNNPRNPDVRGAPWQEVRGYFPHATHVMKKKTTLAPPIGRRVGRLYNFLDFPFLRTHCIAAFRKDRSR